MERPAVVVEPEGEDRHTAYASWNGATEVARWQVLGGRNGQSLQPISERGREGFETAVPFQSNDAVVAVRALNDRGAVLGTSEPVAIAQPDD